MLYVNGIALGVLELKRSTVSVAEGIRQNLDNQKKEFIEPFFSTVQLVMAGNDTEGLRYGAIQTPEKYYLTWKEAGPGDNPLDRALRQLCGKARFLELIHDFIVFDAGIKKICRHNQYFGVRAAQEHVKRREGGIIWHTQGSGKSLTMVWLAKWIRENVKDARVLIITDRTELDEQIEKVFKGVNEDIYRTKSGADLIAKLNATTPWLICSLIHKFGGKEDGEEVGDIEAFVEELKKSLPKGFQPKGDLFVFVDECHRTQSGELHEAMKAILPGRHVHRLHRHAAAQGRQEEEHRDLRPLHPHLQVRRGGEGRRRARPALRGARHRPEHHVAGEDRPVVRGQDQGPDRLSPRRSSSSAGARCRRCCPASRGWRRSSPTS